MEEALHARSQVVEMLQQELNSADQQKQVRHGSSCTHITCSENNHMEVQSSSISHNEKEKLYIGEL